MEQAIKNHTKWQRAYFLKNPWARYWQNSKGRAKKKGWEHTLKVVDFKELWIRDKAHLLKSPSIDCIDSKKGYINGNCRFIERSLNISLGNIGKIPWHKGRVGVRTNKKGGTSWNKGKKQKHG
jgi:hypothetical protein